MAKNNRRDQGLEDEAKAYVSGLPDETAAGRMVNDAGVPSEGWRPDQDQQSKPRNQSGQPGASVKGDPSRGPDKRNAGK